MMYDSINVKFILIKVSETLDVEYVASCQL